MTDCPPHWLKSITQLTELEGQSQNHRLPFVQQFPVRSMHIFLAKLRDRKQRITKGSDKRDKSINTAISKHEQDKQD